jgi:hypothetical protein
MSAYKDYCDGYLAAGTVDERAPNSAAGALGLFDKYAGLEPDTEAGVLRRLRINNQEPPKDAA